MGMLVDGVSLDPEALNALIRREEEMLQLAAQVAKHGPGYGQQQLQSTEGGDSIVQQNVVRAETLVPQGAKAPKQKPEEEPTYRLRKKMGLV